MANWKHICLMATTILLFAFSVYAFFLASNQAGLLGISLTNERYQRKIILVGILLIIAIFVVIKGAISKSLLNENDNNIKIDQETIEIVKEMERQAEENNDF